MNSAVVLIQGPALGGISALTAGSGRGGDVRVNAGRLLIEQGTVSASTVGPGLGGNVTVLAQDLLMNGGTIESQSTKGAPAGDLQVTLLGGATLVNSAITTASPIGRAGNLSLSVGTNLFINSASLITATAGTNAGNISLVAQRSVRIGQAAVVAQTRGLGQDSKGGDISLSSPQVTLDDSNVSAQASGMGASGGIRITSSRLAALNGDSISAASSGTGAAGDLQITSQRFDLATGATLGVSAAEAHAGDIRVTAGTTNIVGATITAQSGADGGNIVLKTGRLLYVRDSSISAKAGRDGGAILLDPQVIVLDGAIVNGLSAGTPVTVRIVATGLLMSGTRILTDTPQTFPTSDISGGLVSLSTSLSPPEMTLQPSCPVRISAGISSFILTGVGGEAPVPGGWLPDDGTPPDSARR